MNDGTGSPRLLDRNFVAALIAQTLFCAGNVLWVHYSRWINFLNGSEIVVGLFTGLAPIVGFVMRPQLGNWIDTIGAKWSTVVGALMMGSGAALNLLTGDLGAAVFVSRVLSFLGGALFFSSSITYVVQTVGFDRRTEALGYLGCGGFFGMVVGPFISDSLFTSEQRSIEQYRLMFGTVALLAFASAVVTTFQRAGIRPDRTSAPAGFAEFFRNCRAHWPGSILWVNVLFGVAMTLPFVFLSRFGDTVGIRSVGFYFAVYGLWAITLRLTIRNPASLGRRKLMVIGLACFALGAWCYLGIDSRRIWMVWPAALLSATGHSLVFHIMLGLTLDSFPKRLQGTGAALSYMAMDSGIIVFSPLLGWMIQLFGFQALFHFVAVASLGVAGLYVHLERVKSRVRPTTTVENREPASAA